MTSVVTGAFGYIGRAVASCLLEKGESVRTITTHPNKPDPFAGQVPAAKYDFKQPERLIAHLQGADTLYNTYWIRFPHAGATFEGAVANTRTLFECARQAEVRRIVHISVTNAAIESDLPYYAGKGQQEMALRTCGVPYTIVRPTLVYGQGDILVNNIAWLLRRFPVFPIFAGGGYRLQPVFIEDLAEITVNAASSPIGTTIDAAGPDIYTFREFVRLMADRLNVKSLLLPVPPGLGITLGKLIGAAVGDMLLTSDELKGLMDEMLTTTQEPTGTTAFSNWLEENAQHLGQSYASELGRHFNYGA